jgi:hypothetical protein
LQIDQSTVVKKSKKLKIKYWWKKSSKNEINHQN